MHSRLCDSLPWIAVGLKAGIAVSMRDLDSPSCMKKLWVELDKSLWDGEVGGLPMALGTGESKTLNETASMSEPFVCN